MNAKQLRQTIEKGNDYQAFAQDHPDAYLAHAFVMQKNGHGQWELGYFDPATKEITTFGEDGKKIASDKALSQTGEVPELELEQAALTYDEAMKSVDSILKEHYSKHTIQQRICILQHLETATWNITLVTQAFSTINIRLDAITKQLISHQERSLMDLGTMVPGKKGK